MPDIAKYCVWVTSHIVFERLPMNKISTTRELTVCSNDVICAVIFNNCRIMNDRMVRLHEVAGGVLATHSISVHFVHFVHFQALSHTLYFCEPQMHTFPPIAENVITFLRSLSRGSWSNAP